MSNHNMSSDRRGPLRQKLYIEQDGMCAICYWPMHMDKSNPADPLYASFDHLKRCREGGTNAKANILLTHVKCNLARN